jgi:colanic acid/amylovoran biosynthesis glycosyltransferase
MIIDIYAYDKELILGGPMVWLQRIVPLLAERGHHVRLRLLNWSDVENGVLFQWCKANGIDVEATRFSSTESNVEWIIRHHDSNPPDVALLNHVTPALLLAGHIRRSGVPTVAVLHSDDDFYSGVAERFINGLSKDAVSAAVFVSKELLTKYSNTRNECLKLYIPYGVPCPDYQATFPANKPFGIAYVGRLAQEQKRITDVVRAFEKCMANSENLHGFLIGDGPDRSMVEAQVHQSPFRNRLNLCGSMHHEHIQKYISDNCQFICLLSDYEGLPIALMEAMAVGLVPVCAKTDSGIPELVKHHWNGFLLDRNAPQLLDCLTQLTSNASTWQQMSTNNKQIISQNYSLSVAINGWCDLLQALAAKPRKRTSISSSFQICDLPQPHTALWAEDSRNPAIESKEVRMTSRFKRITLKISNLFDNIFC